MDFCLNLFFLSWKFYSQNDINILSWSAWFAQLGLRRKKSSLGIEQPSSDDISPAITFQVSVSSFPQPWGEIVSEGAYIFLKNSYCI